MLKLYRNKMQMPQTSKAALQCNISGAIIIGLVMLSFGGCQKQRESDNSKSDHSRSTAAKDSEVSKSSTTSTLSNSDGALPSSKELASSEQSNSTSGAAVRSAISFRTAVDTGIDFKREDDMRGQCRIFESTGGGVGVIDLDRDGEADLVFTGGCKVPEQLDSSDPTCAIYRNIGNVKFRQVTLSSRMLKSGYCQGVAVGDYDNDGFDDLYITALGSNALFHNQGDGTFVELTQQLGVDDPRWSTSCAFADVNLDGALDLYVVNYLDDSPSSPLLCRNEKSPTGFEQCPPAKYSGVNDRLFLGDGSGGFTDVTDSCGLADKKGKGLGVVICDFDKKGLPEIYVSNDGQANFLFQLSHDDQGKLKLDEIAMSSGVALSAAGYAQASMGIAAGDGDRDGLIDLHVTNFYGDYNTVYKNLGDLRFEDVTRFTGMAGPSKKFLGWGTVFADFDADGWSDLFVANGHVEDRTWNGRGEPFQMQPQLFHNLRDGKFADVSSTAGEYFRSAWLGRGVATVDLNHDNAIDVVVAHQLARPEILLNQNIGHGQSIELIGRSSNRNAIGARVNVISSGGNASNPAACAELVGGTSFQSAVENRLYLPKDARVEIRWPSGRGEIVEASGGRFIWVEQSRH